MSSSLLSAREARTLEAVCLALLPSLGPPDGGENGRGLMARSASDLEVASLVVDVLASEPPETRAQFRRLLAILGSPVFGLLACGRASGFADLSPQQRERALQRMSTSPIPMLRQAFQAFKRPATFLFYAAPGGGDANPNWPAIKYEPTRPPQATRATP
jgi:gluconate 2-dehydrogenase subunit 3-like protein